MGKNRGEIESQETGAAVAWGVHLECFGSPVALHHRVVLGMGQHKLEGRFLDGGHEAFRPWAHGGLPQDSFDGQLESEEMVGAWAGLIGGFLRTWRCGSRLRSM